MQLITENYVVVNKEQWQAAVRTRSVESATITVLIWQQASCQFITGNIWCIKQILKLLTLEETALTISLTTVRAIDQLTENVKENSKEYPLTVTMVTISPGMK